MSVWIFLTVFALICLGFTLLVNWKEDEMKKMKYQKTDMVVENKP